MFTFSVTLTILTLIYNIWTTDMTRFLSITSLSLSTTRPFILSELTFQNQSITWSHSTRCTHCSFIHNTAQHLFYHRNPCHQSLWQTLYKERTQLMCLHITQGLFFLKLKECEDRKVTTSRLLELVLKYKTPFQTLPSFFFPFKKIKVLLWSFRPLAFLPGNSQFSCASFETEFKSRASLRNSSQMLRENRWEGHKDLWGGQEIGERRHCSHPKASRRMRRQKSSI